MREEREREREREMEGGRERGPFSRGKGLPKGTELQIRGLQEKAFGGHDRATLKLLKELGQRKAGDQRCQRLKTGTVLIRDFEGVRHTVSIVPGGFIWQEKTYTSLSAIARIITGTNWNGPRFFGLREHVGPKTKKESGAA